MHSKWNLHDLHTVTIYQFHGCLRQCGNLLGGGTQKETLTKGRDTHKIGRTEVEMKLCFEKKSSSGKNVVQERETLLC